MTDPGPPDDTAGSASTVAVLPRFPALSERTPPVGDTTARPRRRILDARPGLAVVILIATYGCSRLAAAFSGVRYDDSVIQGKPLTDMWQLLDVRLLHDHLATSVWHLNMQPPLFNLYAGFLLKLPTGLRRPTEVAFSLLLGLVIVLCAYLLLVELRVPRLAALVVTLIGVVASPAYLLYENWLNYSYPCAALATFGAWSLARFMRTQQARFGVGFFGAYAAMVLLNSSYQVEWMLVAAVPVLVVLRRQWRTVLAVSFVPLVVVAGWYVKDFVQVGTTTTSSWLGMNLARDVLFKSPAGQIAELQRQGRLNPVASVTPFAGPEVYVPKYVLARPSPITAIGSLHKQNGSTNFNNPLYVAISSQYLHDDLTWIRAHPHEYANDVVNSVGVWFVGTDQNFTNSINWPSMRSYASFYDKSVEWQPVQNPAPGFVVFARGWHRPAWLSGQAMVVYAMAVVGVPVLAWRRRRTDPALAGTLAVLWWTTIYAFTTSSLLEIGENERFRSELGPVPIVLATAVIAAVIHAAWSGWERRRRGAVTSAG